MLFFHAQKNAQKCKRIILLPLLFLCVFAFLANTYHSSISTVFEEVCDPKTNIVFLKTHKCAGSSIQNILMRYGDARNLSFVLPKTGNYLGHPVPFSPAFVSLPRLHSYNILTHHTRLDYRAIKTLMPPNSVYITIIRDPVQTFESSFSYYNLHKFFGCKLKDFIKKFPNRTARLYRKRYRGKFGINQMMFDLGASSAIFDKNDAIHRYIHKLDDWFDLILVADRMDESLILLKHFLCWEIDDVVTFKLNARNPKFKSKLTEEQKQALKKLNHADVELYNYFLEKFNRNIDAFGRERMAKEIEELKYRTQMWYDFCVAAEQPFEKTTRDSKYYHNSKVMILETYNNTSNSSCHSMTMEELPFTDYLRQKQMLNFSIHNGIL